MDQVCVTCANFDRWLSKETGHGGFCQLLEEPMRFTDSCGDWSPKGDE